MPNQAARTVVVYHEGAFAVIDLPLVESLQRDDAVTDGVAHSSRLLHH